MKFTSVLSAVAGAFLLAPAQALPEDYIGIVEVAADGTLSPIEARLSDDHSVEKRAGNVRGYIYTTNCQSTYYEWANRNGCFAYYNGNTLMDMYSVWAMGSGCSVEFFQGNAQCAYFRSGRLEGSNVCGRYNNGQAFKSVRVNCD
ncbi:hypothetical protein QBC34DRAFT_436024 [Podospora aff. communis PSN243]|uniref:Beta/gamma crystallin 'Greek key' domain-containing protein n=1 Tax=Podospora aff. communis PSN243 TaxID=3040156 RepID=A0AAV9GVZ0_9PEZI|nr:hypothetical protein QBC34DRAFT_436024 [Podospora aff. communis PSN243]